MYHGGDALKIKEMFLLSKKGDQESCEDRIVVTEDFACVIDGSTSKSDNLWDGKTSGLMASKLLGDAVISLPRETERQELIRLLSASITNYYVMNDLYSFFESNPSERFTATIAIYSKYHHQIWMVGDCQCMIDDDLYTNGMIIDDVMANARALYLHMELAKGKNIDDLIKHDTGKQYIEPLLKQQSIFQNLNIQSPYSYGAIDGFDILESTIKSVRVKEDANYIVLSTDGYPILRNSLAASEAELEAILTKDPLCISIYKSTKGKEINNISYDDRAYIRLEI
jgi:hypothetical protein